MKRGRLQKPACLRAHATVLQISTMDSLLHIVAAGNVAAQKRTPCLDRSARRDRRTAGVAFCVFCWPWTIRKWPLSKICSVVGRRLGVWWWLLYVWLHASWWILGPTSPPMDDPRCALSPPASPLPPSPLPRQGNLHYPLPAAHLRPQETTPCQAPQSSPIVLYINIMPGLQWA